MNKKEVIKFLGEEKIDYELLEHEPVYTIEEMQKAGITDRGEVCKNLFLRDAKGRTHFLVVVPEEKRVDLKGLSNKLGSSRLSFASEKRLKKYLGVKQGAVSPLGILNDENAEVIVVLDRTLEGKKRLGVHPNDNTATVFLKSSDLFKIIEAHGNKIIEI